MDTLLLEITASSGSSPCPSTQPCSFFLFLFLNFVFIGSKTHKHNLHTVTEIMHEHTLENRSPEINYLKKRKKERKKNDKTYKGEPGLEETLQEPYYEYMGPLLYNIILSIL